MLTGRKEGWSRIIFHEMQMFSPSHILDQINILQHVHVSFLTVHIPWPWKINGNVFSEFLLANGKHKESCWNDLRKGSATVKTHAHITKYSQRKLLPFLTPVIPLTPSSGQYCPWANVETSIKSSGISWAWSCEKHLIFFYFFFISFLFFPLMPKIRSNMLQLNIFFLQITHDISAYTIKVSTVLWN